MVAEIKPIKVNIVEREEWKPFDSAQNDSILTSAFEAAWDSFKAMPREYPRLIEDLLKAGGSIHDWFPGTRKTSQEQLDLLVQALADGDLEETQRAITDALTWAYEEVFTPTDGDIYRAIRETKTEMRENFTFYEGDLEFWAPILEKDLGESGILGSLLHAPRSSPGGAIVYRREPNHWDRFLEFDFSNSEVVNDLLKKLDEDGVRKLNAWLKDFSGEFLSIFFKKLKKIMDDTDIYYRADFREHWNALLTDRFIVKGVRKELNEYLKEHPVDAG